MIINKFVIQEILYTIRNIIIIISIIFIIIIIIIIIIIKSYLY